MGPGAPRCFDDYIYSDRPLFALHVATFTDGTLVSLSSNHIATDLGGILAILNAWKLVLAGKPESVPPFVGYRDDPMEGLYNSAANEDYLLADKKLTFLNFARFGIWTLLDSWWNPREPRTVCLPSKLVANMMKQTRDQLPKSSNGIDAFISDVNIILAGFLRAVAGGMSPNTNITCLQAVDPRPRLSAIFNPDAAHVCNAPAAIFSFLTAKEVCQRSVSDVALGLRRDLVAQLEEEQMKAVAADAHKHMVSSGYPAMYGEPNASLVVSSSWAKADYCRRVDFSRAVLSSGAKAQDQRPREAKPGHPVYMQGASLERSSGKDNTICVITGKDWDQNLWLSVSLTPSAWPRLMAHFRQFE